MQDVCLVFFTMYYHNSIIIYKLLFIKKIKYFYFLSFVFCYNSVKKDYEMTPTVMLKFYLMSFDWNKK